MKITGTIKELFKKGLKEGDKITLASTMTDYKVFCIDDQDVSLKNEAGRIFSGVMNGTVFVWEKVEKIPAPIRITPCPGEYGNLTVIKSDDAHVHLRVREKNLSYQELDVLHTQIAQLMEILEGNTK